jgi:hypothetical protein
LGEKRHDAAELTRGGKEEKQATHDFHYAVDALGNNSDDEGSIQPVVGLEHMSPLGASAP